MRLHLSGLIVGVLGLTVLGCGSNTRQHATSDAGESAPLTCQPTGVSVACVGSGGCRGAQVCGKDGSYGKCDCGVAPLTTCGVTGSTAMCAGIGACPGAQLCGADGSFGPCVCAPLTPALDAGTATPITLQVTAPTADALWKGTVRLSGTTTGPVSVVGASIGGGPVQLATGTSHWTLSYDTTHLPNGSTTVLVGAQGAGQSVSVAVSVIVDNLDPVVGGWRLRNAYWYYQGPRCWVRLLPSGAFSDPCGIIAYYSQRWTRESPDTLTIAGLAYRATVSSDGLVLTLKQLSNPGTVWVFDLVERIDPYLPTTGIDLDGGTQPGNDGGYVPPNPHDDAGSYVAPGADAGN